jgi:hypothetical protein
MQIGFNLRHDNRIGSIFVKFYTLYMIRRKLFLAVILVSSAINIRAQNFHVVVFGGVSNYQGDLQDQKYTFSQAHPAFGFGGLYEITDNLSARANVTFGTVSANDKDSKNINDIQRNLNFTSPITDINLGLEYDILSLNQHSVTPYIFAGISVFHFNPYTIDTAGHKVYLQPLGTEGQGFYPGRSKYSLTQIAIPFGGGFKFAINDNVRLGVEVGLRKLFTDYLDDVSMTYADKTQLLANNGAEAVELAFRGDELNKGLTYPTGGTIRGNPKSKDWYYFTMLTLSFRIPGGGEKYDGPGGKSKVGCPTRVF